MDQRELFALLRRQPFEPFRLFLTTGERYDVRHPDMALVGRSTVHVGIPAATSVDGPAREVKVLSLASIASAEPLPKRDAA